MNTIIFALNKIDEIHKDEGETPKTIVEYLKKSYKYKFPDVKKVPEIWPIAAYPALVARNQEPLEYQGKENRTEEEKKRLEDMSGLGDFENRLFTFLTCGEKAKQQLLSPVEKVLAAAKKTQGKYKEESAVLEKKPDMSEMENQILEIKKTIDELKQQILDSENAVRSKIKDELKTAIEDLTAQMARLNEQKRDQIDKIEDLDELEEYQHNFEKVFIQRVSSIEQKTDEKLIDQIVSVIKDQSFSQMEIIEQRMKKANVELRLSVDEHLEIQETVFKVGLEEMNKEEEALEYQLKQLEEEATKAELDFYRARKIEREKKNIEREIENLKKKEENIKNQVLPRVERYTEKRIVHEKRGGVFGRVADVLVGEKRVESFEYIKDDSERKEVREMRDKNCRNIESEIKQKEAELSRKENVDSVLAEQIQIRATAQANAKREELVKTKEKHIQEINKNYKRKMRRMKKEFLDYCDYITEELLDQMEKSLKKSEQLYIDIVLSSVGGTLKKVLTDKQEDLKQLERKLQESEEDRNIRIETLKKKINSINELIGQALDLHTELSNIAVDKIQQEDI